MHIEPENNYNKKEEKDKKIENKNLKVSKISSFLGTMFRKKK